MTTPDDRHMGNAGNRAEPPRAGTAAEIELKCGIVRLVDHQAG